MHEAGGNGEAGKYMKPPPTALCIRIVLRGYLNRTEYEYRRSRHANIASPPSSASSFTSAQSYPRAKSERRSSFSGSAEAFLSSADIKVDFPVDGCPSTSTCFAGIERDLETESRIEDQRSCGGASGEDGRELSMIFLSPPNSCKPERSSGRAQVWG